MPLHPLVRIAIAKQSIVEDSFNGFFSAITKNCPTIPDIQKTEMRKAFYGGFMSAFDLMQDVSVNMKEDDAVKILENVETFARTEVEKMADWDKYRKKL